MFFHTTFQFFYLKLIFLRILINFFFFSLQALRKLREVAELKRYVAHLEWERLQELELAKVGTPASQLADLVSAGVKKAGELAPPSSRAPSNSVEGKWAPSPLGQDQKKAHHTPTITTLVALKEKKATSQEMHLPSGPSEAIAGPLGTSTLLTALQRRPPSPLLHPSASTSYQILQASQLDGLQQNVHMWAVQKAYLQLGLNSIPLSSGTSGVCLVYPQCGMSYLDPSKIHLHGRKTHKLLFH